MKEVEHFYFDQTEPNKSCFLAIRDIILRSNPGISQAMKYKMPCFIFKKKAMCYLWKDKKTNEPYILFVNGNKMDHPELEMGNRARMKIFRINPNKDIPISTIEKLIKTNIEFYENNDLQTIGRSL